MIDIQELSKSFVTPEGNSDIFTSLNFSLNPGEFAALIGPSGSGKSTFLNLLSGIDRDYGGKILLGGKDISLLGDNEITRFRGQNISYIFQNFRLIENLTVQENIDLVVDINGLERNFDTREILKLVGLEHKINTYVFNLSGGESQRVAIARAFVGKTSLLLADEPTGALDNANKKIVMDLIAQLHKKIGNTIVMITHDDEVAQLAQKIYKLKNQDLEKIS